MKPIFTSTQSAGEVLNLRPTKVHELISSGELRSVKLGGRRLVYIDSIEELVDRLGAAQAA